MSTPVLIWLAIFIVAAGLYLASANRKDYKQLAIGFLVLAVVTILIGGGYAYLAWRDGLLDVSVFDWLFGPR